MNRLVPVKDTYKRFLGKALTACTVVVACSFFCGPGLASAEEKSSPDAKPSLNDKAQQLAEALLETTHKGVWYASSSILTNKLIESNPPVKAPRIPITCGNSYSGIFDTNKAREATRKLFALYGFKLVPNVQLEGEQYEFTADGFDPKQGIGFELINAESVGYMGSRSGPDEPRQRKLQEDELPMLGRDVESGDLRMFVADARAYPRMDGDQYTPMRYYLASVVDYLNWVNEGREIDPDSVLGEVRAVYQRPLQR